MSNQSICVAICTRDRTVQLERLLHSLSSQTRRPDRILVIDNAPASNTTHDLITELRNSSVSYIREPVAGLDFARNRALQETDCDIVAFVDDDAVVNVKWVAAINNAFDINRRIALCAGRVNALTLSSDGQRLFEANGGFDKGTTRIIVPTTDHSEKQPAIRPLIAWSFGLGVGCNLAVCRAVALELGGFDEALDLGAAMPGGGDTDMIWRILEAGYLAVYEPEALVSHEHRATLGGAVDQIIGHNKASMAMLAKAWKTSSLRNRLPIGLYITWRLLKPGVRLIRRSVGRDPLPFPVLVKVWQSCITGLFSYPQALRLAVARKREALINTVVSEKP